MAPPSTQGARELRNLPQATPFHGASWLKECYGQKWEKSSFSENHHFYLQN